MMYHEKEISKVVLEILESRKTISKMLVTGMDFKLWLNTISEINGLDRYATTFGDMGENLQEWIIPKPLSVFIAPSEVTINGSREDKNLIKPTGVKEVTTSEEETDTKEVKALKVLSRREFNEFGNKINAMFRQALEMVPVTREPMLLADAAKYQIVDGLTIASELDRMPFGIEGSYKETYMYSKPVEEAVYSVLEHTFPTTR